MRLVSHKPAFRLHLQKSYILYTFYAIIVFICNGSISRWGIFRPFICNLDVHKDFSTVCGSRPRPYVLGQISSTRCIAVAATHEVIKKTLEYMRNPAVATEKLVRAMSSYVGGIMSMYRSVSSLNSIVLLLSQGFLDESGEDETDGPATVSSVPAVVSGILTDAVLYNGVLHPSDALFVSKGYLR